ncbi:hypothetical protein [Jeongeupia sp. USM3]|uniref:hypothetical protein n=1 Tax=Jeongeupia sp. USM3 TaxID=1906741 RepID=UPI00089DFD20|nr:hypothetical protein [Jeongeupia sp. USM3]AOX99679.1 hypothetical protein BJP62_03935 [Jeongeupia sp. USM3]
MSRSESGRHGRHAGFAYLWVLLLVALMSLGLTVGIEIAATAVQRDKEKSLLGIGRQFREALRRYYETPRQGGADAGKEYPASLEDLLKDNRFPGTKRHLRQIFVDPITGKAEWGVLRVSGRIVGVYSLSKKIPIKQDHFEPDDMGFRGKQQYRDWQFTYPADLMLRPENASAVATTASTPMGLAPSPMPVAPPKKSEYQ